MSMTSFEVNTPQFKEGLLVREKRLLQPRDTQFADWLAIRHDFMVRRGWRTPENGEWDEYDDAVDTAQLALYGEAGKFLFGMRLTPIASVESSMSWRMVEDSTIPEQVMEHYAVLPSQGLWDLTRLVPGPEVQKEESHQAIPRLFHEGLAYCQQQGDDNPAWVFALDSATNRWLTAQGVTIMQLGKDRVGSDRHDTLFGVVYPAEIDQANGEFARRSRQGAA